MNFKTEFPILGQRTFLNHAAVAPIPTRGAYALRHFAEEAALEGATAWPRWAEQLKRARGEAGALLGAPDQEIGFVHNTTHGLLCVANSLPFRPGDNIVLPAHEFPANVQPWRQLGARGVALRFVAEQPDHTYSIDDFISTIDVRTRLIATSLVQYSTGYRMPVENLADVCRSRGIWLCVDGMQGIGAMPTRVADLGCDFIVADGHKWMLATEGLGILWMRESLIDAMNESMTGWVGRVKSWDYEDYEQPLHRSARRFEEGSYNMAGAAALAESLALINEVGIEKVWEKIERLTDRLCEGGTRMGFEVKSPRKRTQKSGIVALHREGMDAAGVARALAERKIDVAPRRGWLRVSPHFYNDDSQIDELLAALHEIVR